MTTKPDLVSSVVVMPVALLLGLAASALVVRAGQIPTVERAAPKIRPTHQLDSQEGRAAQDSA